MSTNSNSASLRVFASPFTQRATASLLRPGRVLPVMIAILSIIDLAFRLPSSVRVAVPTPGLFVFSTCMSHFGFRAGRSGNLQLAWPKRFGALPGLVSQSLQLPKEAQLTIIAPQAASGFKNEVDAPYQEQADP